MLRRELHAALQAVSAEREPLDLVADVPITEEFVDDLAQARIADARASGLYGVFPDAWQELAGISVHGILSHGFLRHYAWTLDFDSMTMSFAAPAD